MDSLNERALSTLIFWINHRILIEKKRSDIPTRFSRIGTYYRQREKNQASSFVAEDRQFSPAVP